MGQCDVQTGHRLEGCCRVGNVLVVFVSRTRPCAFKRKRLQAPGPFIAHEVSTRHRRSGMRPPLSLQIQGLNGLVPLGVPQNGWGTTGTHQIVAFSLRRHEAVGEFVCQVLGSSRTGSMPSISLRRGSRKIGSSKSRPRASTGSSTANPGMSVAISNRTPPGSRK